MDPILNMAKYKVEGRLEEMKVILGWFINKQLVHVFLTKNKARDWIRYIDKTLQQGHCSCKLLETMIGQFNHMGFIIIISK